MPRRKDANATSRGMPVCPTRSERQPYSGGQAPADVYGARLCEPQHARKQRDQIFILPREAGASNRLALLRGKVAASHRLALRRLAREGAMLLNTPRESTPQSSSSWATAQSRPSRVGRGQASLVFAAKPR